MHYISEHLDFIKHETNLRLIEFWQTLGITAVAYKKNSSNKQIFLFRWLPNFKSLLSLSDTLSLFSSSAFILPLPLPHSFFLFFILVFLFSFSFFSFFSLFLECILSSVSFALWYVLLNWICKPFIKFNKSSAFHPKEIILKTFKCEVGPADAQHWELYHHNQLVMKASVAVLSQS